jgi:hypothetical protein
MAAPVPSPVALALQRAVRLTVVLSDPQGALGGLSSATQLIGILGPPLSVTITDSAGAARFVPFSRSAGSVYEFSMFVPEKAQFTLNATSSVISLADESGNTLANNIYEAQLVIPSIASLVASTPAWIPLWLSGRTGPSSKIINVQVNGLFAQ